MINESDLTEEKFTRSKVFQSIARQATGMSDMIEQQALQIKALKTREQKIKDSAASGVPLPREAPALNSMSSTNIVAENSPNAASPRANTSKVPELTKQIMEDY